MCKLKYSFSHRLPVGHRGLRAIIPAMMLGLIVGCSSENHYQSLAELLSGYVYFILVMGIISSQHPSF